MTMAKITTGNMNYGSAEENSVREKFVELLRECPIPDSSLMSNLGLFLNSKNLSRLLFMDYLYRQAIDVQGVIMDFGTRWGQNMALFTAMRGIYEPYNRHKKIIGFDTFKGFPSISKKDGTSQMISKGNVSVTDNYLPYLSSILECQERD